ncbi:phospholipase A1-Igamma1, chloroplastic [Iris pallida]|uniref:Phospholipase A1-Igamma1, chloroplastic n=1 Tax=Iris pallida TaxID=29817 RepID=A0AAX6HGA8_IRIPA|nr:phospholipase A1-Igamma1, chloroplastic [Iris pallida]
MAMSSCTASTIHHIPLPSNTAKTGHQAVPQQPMHCIATANATATTAAPPENNISQSLQSRRASSSSINLPTVLTNLFHLSTHKSNPNSSAHLNTLPTPTPISAAGRSTPTLSPKEDISSLYPQIHGSADWSPLLDPLHPYLRREIVKYGEFSQATYDAFDYNPFSKYCGSCLYSRPRFFEKLGLARSGYGVEKYLYAMSHVELPRWLERSVHADTWSKDSNWMGYVAASDDQESRRIGCRNIVVCWRGTVAQAEWFEDIQGKLELLDGEHDKNVRVEHGFLSLYTSKSEATRYNKTSASEQVMEEIERLVKLYKQRGEKVSLTVTGHSLGGALALLTAFEAASTIPDLPVSVISFGAPRVGNGAFAEKLKQLQVKTLRVVVKQDVVPKLPGILFNEGGLMGRQLEWVYTHVGLELGLNVNSSPYLKHGTMDFSGFHSLETYLHLVDGYLSGDSGFRTSAKRDVALVNKACGMLKDDLRIPTCWNQSANKGMVCNAYGRWVHPQRAPEDVPSPMRKPQALPSPSQDHRP